jgi:serine/threonine-protein kinase
LSAPPEFAQALRDRYVLERELGRGGMATVYLARDLRHDRPVALKVVHEDLARSLGRERFLREIRTAARLQHPHILSVHDSGEAAGRLWFTMPYVEGESLRQRLARERQLPLREALRITEECARALDHAHQHGVIHRDIKPENVLLTADGSTLVADFGIAKALDAADAEGVGAALTETGLVVGTPAYMSPEQSTGQRELDARTDVYSLGCVLYEMLAGEPPYVGASPQAVIAKRLTEPVPRVGTLRHVPPQIERAVTTALARSPADRFLTAGDLAGALAAGDAPGPAERVRFRLGRRARTIATIAAAMASGAGAGWLLLTRPWESRGGADSVAVLPFVNLSREPGNEYFADGIAEELTATLGRVEGLRVAARTSAFAYKGKNPDLSEIRQRLGVESVLEGSVRRAGERVRVTARLVDARDGRQLWSDIYEREARDVFGVQQELSRAIAVALRGRLAESQVQARQAPVADAYDLYLRGRHAWRRRTWEGLLQARDLLEEAIERDPRFAAAHAGLADVYAVMALWNDVPPGETYPRAKAAALRALALDSLLAGPHSTLGEVYTMHEWDWTAAEREFRRSLELDPDDANTWHWYGGDLLAIQGRWEEAIAATQRARALDPLSPTLSAGAGMTLYRAGRYREAEQLFQAVKSVDPDFLLLNSGWGQVMLVQERYQPAIEALERSVDPALRHSVDVALLGHAYAKVGRREEARRLLRELENRAARGYVSGASVALAYAGLGDTASVFRWLERAAEAGDPILAYYFAIEPLMAAYRRYPRGARLLQRMGLDPAR